MSLTPQLTIKPREMLAVLKKHVLLWAVPLAVCTVGAALYGLLRERDWRATQAMYVRDEAIGRLGPPGRFENADAMKTAQETILEVARNHSVVKAALTASGPGPNDSASPAWPTADDVERMRGKIRVTAPAGLEFGKTEVIYLSVDAPSRQRAVALTRSVGNQLDAQLKHLRNQRAQSVIGELEQTLELARKELADATKKLETIEIEVGSDLGELRILNDTGAGDSNLRRSLTEINNELRAAQNRQTALQQQKKLLLAARENPDKLIATPNQLLESQPALKRLKDGLVDAQLKTSDLSGRMSADHPLVKAAVEAERQVRDNLHAEVEVALRGVTADLEVSQALVDSLAQQARQVEQRLDRLAGLRARYNNLVADVRQRTQIVEEAQKELADARASEGAAESSSLITRIDEPVTGNEPLGPSFGTIMLIGFGGGLMIGLGAVFLTVPLVRMRGRRWSDLFSGRRATDVQGGRRGDDRHPSRRTEDGPSSAAAVGANRRAVDPPVTQLAPPAEATPFDTTLAASTFPPTAAAEELPAETSSGERRNGDRRRGDRRSSEREATPAEETTAGASSAGNVERPAVEPRATEQPIGEPSASDKSSSRSSLAKSLRRLEDRGA
jgi:uncharacterized protein involved in exopolysaccharide biosynthesis